MSAQLQFQTKTIARPNLPFTPIRRGLLQRCTATEECEQCRRKRLDLQRVATGSLPVGDVPPIVHDVLRSPGQPLDTATRAFMEPRFGHDFSQVRVHTDARAAESARAVNALAYTVGQHIVFRERQFRPETEAGSQLLAHELTHEVQQGLGHLDTLQLSEVNSPSEREANDIAEVVCSLRDITEPVGPTVRENGIWLQRQAEPSPTPPQLSGDERPPCFGRGGGSQCDPDTGVYEMVYNEDTCCTRDCTELHEQQHKIDFGDCCRALHNKIEEGGDRDKLVEQYDRWRQSGASDWSECNAYTVSVNCAETLRTKNRCDIQSSECCDVIDSYLAGHRRKQREHCGRATFTPLCPF